MDSLIDRPPAPPSKVGRPVSAPPVPPLTASIKEENPLDRIAHANIAKLCGGFSPLAIAEAAADWALHLGVSPGRQSALALSAVAGQITLLDSALAPLRGGASHAPTHERPADRRFEAEDWRQWPFSLYADGFLAAERWWADAMSEVHGASPHHLAFLNFLARQALDTVAPSNFLATNPVALKQTLREGGLNLARGAMNYAADLQRLLRNERSEAAKAFMPGETVALTKGAVVARTRLAEVIQYSPTTKSVRAEPVVIAPAWIMKYYILDLQPENSLIRHLVDSGFTVFCISWRNPTSRDRDVGFDDYRREGLMPAISAALAITGADRVHLAGYCIGGTLAAIAAARMARDGDDRLQSLTLIAAQTDFEEAGELRLFIDDSQLALLDDMMWEQGALEADQMAGTFDLMRSNDLIWSRAIHNYLMGEPETMDDLSAWSSDATRMPYRMHREYLRRLYLNNDLAEGRFLLNGHPVALQDIRAPMFVIGTERDHVAPWRSVFKIHHLTDTEITFVLVNGGHNRGVVAPPGQGERHFRIATTASTASRPDPDAWAAAADIRQESWWLAWFDWLRARSTREVAPPPVGLACAGLAPLGPAPGEYVLGVGRPRNRCYEPPPMELGLEGKVVLVTGGSKGIGLACAGAFAAEGARIAICSRSRDNVERARLELKGAFGVAADLSDAAAAGAMIEAVESSVGPVDILVNSAGAARRTPADELTPEVWRAAFDAKFFSYVNVIDPMVKRMAARGHGVIVSVIGGGGKIAAATHLAGGAANAALMLATAGLGAAYASKGVRVVGVSPGLTETDRVAEGLAAHARLFGISVEEASRRSVARIPIGRMASPREVADAVLFLASPRAGYVTGVTLSVDGGQNPVVL